MDLANELLQLRSHTEKNLSQRDYKELTKVIWTNRFFLCIGLATAWIYPNPISVLCISLAAFGQWTIVAHHVCHGGYDNIPNISSRYRSKRFALGWRRYVDWLDWIYPPAWHYEHNTLHHFYTNEMIDPDVVYYHAKQTVNTEQPIWYRYIMLILYSGVWKPVYYALNTLKAYHEKKNYNYEKSILSYIKSALTYCYLPYISVHFVLVPLLFLPLGWTAVWYVLINKVGAEILTNMHSFWVIIPNHTGEDIPLNSLHFTNKNDFFTRQIISTCNYNTGGFWRDYLQGYLNYQIEHHLFPHLPFSQYPEIQEKVKAICLRHGIDYKQESIFKRMKKSVEILIMGKAPNMTQLETVK